MTQLQDFLLRQDVKRAILFHALKILQAANALLDRLIVRQHAAEPTLVDIEHLSLRRLFLHSVLRLLLRADEENALALFRQAAKEVVRLVNLAHGLLQINDVDAVPLREDVLRHLRIPTAGLMSEMDTGLQKLFHRNYCHNWCTSCFFLRAPHPLHHSQGSTGQTSVRVRYIDTVKNFSIDGAEKQVGKV